MQNTYSPSRIGAFDKCKLSYKYVYIDELESDIETIENFRGNMVHQTLEEFYKLIKGGAVKPQEWVISKYRELWGKNYTGNIKIVKKELTADGYFNQGQQCLIDYYDRYHPFNQTKIVKTEHNVNFKVRYNGVEYPFRGKLDRLDWDDKVNIFEIHDYKVTNTLMTQEEADNDWQLGLYHVAVRTEWPDAQAIKLVWHSLLLNKELVSSRTDIQINELQKGVIEKIKEIESCKYFPPEKSVLCNWCDFQNICPLWKHPKEMEELPVNEYKKDPGVRLVTEYKKFEEAKNELKEEIYKIEKEQQKIKEAAIEFAEKEQISIIEGPDMRLKIDVRDELRAPTRSEDQEKWERLRDFLIKEDKYKDVSTVNNNMLNYRLKIWPPELIDKLTKFLIQKEIKAVRLIKK